VGQEHITRTLMNVIQKKRIAHAYLLVGPRGVGKTSVARILAKALNCEKGPTVDPCQECPSCKDIAEGRSLDVLEIDGASNRGIEEIRQLRENIRFSPTRGQFRIYIIDEVHMLTPEAFNALLKTLEEPPLHVKFIFATTAPNRLPATILSRCQRFNFRLISVKELVEQLKKIAMKEKIKVTEEALFQIARHADGSMRDAESILDQLVSFGDKEIKGEDVLSLLGRTAKDIFFKFMEEVINKRLPQALGHFNQIMDQGQSPPELLTDMLDYLRTLLFLKMGKEGEGLLDLVAEDLALLKNQAQAVDEKEIISLINALSSTQPEMRWASSPRLLLEIALAKTIHRASPASLSMAEPGQESYSVKAAAAPQKSNGLTLEEIRTRWPQVIERVKKEKITVGACLIEGEPIKFHHPVLTIHFENEFNFHRETVEKSENKKIVEKVLSDIFKASLMIHCLTVESPPTPPLTNTPPEKAPPRTRSHQDIIDKALELFHGKIVEDKRLNEGEL
jgi:DNA polymerase-3 subunit gamma/tau